MTDLLEVALPLHVIFWWKMTCHQLMNEFVNLFGEIPQEICDRVNPFGWMCVNPYGWVWILTAARYLNAKYWKTAQHYCHKQWERVYTSFPAESSAISCVTIKLLICLTVTSGKDLTMSITAKICARHFKKWEKWL